MRGRVLAGRIPHAAVWQEYLAAYESGDDERFAVARTAVLALPRGDRWAPFCPEMEDGTPRERTEGTRHHRLISKPAKLPVNSASADG